MISKETLLQEITRQVAAAQAGNTQATREALTAIRSLCDVALRSEQVASQSVTQPLQPVQQAVPVMQQVSALSATKRLEEDGANGDSIFDF